MTGTNAQARIFFIETTFQRMAKRPGGLTRDQALRRAADYIDESRPDFADWLDLKLAELSAIVMEAEARALGQAEVERALETCRQIRDTSATMGFELLTFVSKNFCGILEAMKDGAKSDKEVLTCHIDAMLLARSSQTSKIPSEKLAEMTAGLLRVAKTVREPG